MRKKLDNPLEFYKNNSDIIGDNLYKFQTYVAVDSCIKDPTVDVYNTISGAAIRAYLKSDDFTIGLTEIADFLSSGYSDNMFTLDEIQYANPHDIITASIAGDFSLISHSAKESMSKNTLDEQELEI